MEEDKVIKEDSKENITEFYFTYDDGKRLLIILAFLCMCIFGVSFILIGNWFSIVSGSLIFLIGGARVIDIFFFQKLIINKKFLIKKWYSFGEIAIPLINLKAGVSKRVWTGSIFFSSKNSSILQRFFMIFEVFPIGNNEFIRIKKILIEKNVIKGDEDEWNY